MKKVTDKYSTQNPNPKDVIVGKRLRARRTIQGLSQEGLADKLGITFQQVQKYENATNRISASRLLDVCEHLNTTPNVILGWNNNSNDALNEFLKDNDVLKFIRAFKIMPNHAKATVKTVIASFSKIDAVNH